MRQLEIEFVWPLTVQMPLDINYEGCDTRESTCVKVLADGVGIVGSSYAYITSSQLSVADVSSKGITIDGGTLTIKTQPMPWYRKLAFRVMGFKYD